MNQWQTETRGAFRWLRTVEHDEHDHPGVTIRTARAELPCGVVVERVDGAGTPIVFVTDHAGREVEVSPQQAAELAAALGELPAPDRRGNPRDSDEGTGRNERDDGAVLVLPHDAGQG